MSLFDELGLKPGDAAQHALRRELELRRDRWPRPDYFYKGGGDFLLRNGEFWQGRELPEQYENLMGGETGCFGNALEACRLDPSLRYVEGVYSIGASNFTPHAWCIEPGGGLLEVTLPTHDVERYTDAHLHMKFMPVEHWAYCGVVFPLEFVEWHAEALCLPMLDRPHIDSERRMSPNLDLEETHDFPVLKQKFDPNRKVLRLGNELVTDEELHEEGHLE